MRVRAGTLAGGFLAGGRVGLDSWGGLQAWGPGSRRPLMLLLRLLSRLLLPLLLRLLLMSMLPVLLLLLLLSMLPVLLRLLRLLPRLGRLRMSSTDRKWFLLLLR